MAEGLKRLILKSNKCIKEELVMTDYIIRKAEMQDLERIQELSQELIAQEKKKINGEYMTSLEWALTKDEY